MRTPLALLALTVLLATGCTTQPRHTEPSDWVTSMEAVMMAAQVAPRGVTGVFSVHVLAGDTIDGFTYLNSERDYRDQRNLTVRILPKAAAELTRQFGAPLEATLKGKHILVTGTAWRVQIGFYDEGKYTGKYYYQTHVIVERANQIQVQG